MADKRNIVTAIESDGECIDAQFVRRDGEVVVGEYKQIGWAAGPKAFDDDMDERARLHC
jgi:hypothetical protein